MGSKERGKVERVVEEAGESLVIRRQVRWTQNGEEVTAEEDVTVETGQFLALEEPENCRLNFK